MKPAIVLDASPSQVNYPNQFYTTIVLSCQFTSALSLSGCIKSTVRVKYLVQDHDILNNPCQPLNPDIWMWFSSVYLLQCMFRIEFEAAKSITQVLVILKWKKKKWKQNWYKAKKVVVTSLFNCTASAGRWRNQSMFRALRPAQGTCCGALKRGLTISPLVCTYRTHVAGTARKLVHPKRIA